MINILSRKILKIANLQVFLREEIASKGELSSTSGSAGVEAVAGWGHKPTADKARRKAQDLGKPYFALEDGFLRSVALGCEGAEPLSLSVDPVGVYYDATEPSQLEKWLNDWESWMTLELEERARDAVRRLRLYDLSKYNNAPSFTTDDELRLRNVAGARPESRLILVVDQTAGDASLTLGGVDDAALTRMLDDAMKEPNAVVVVKAHPDVVAGKKQGALQHIPEGVHVLTESFAPLSFLKIFDAVYTATSQLGFEALMLGKTVHTYGAPFYAGWGLTVDHGAVPARRCARPPFEAVFVAAYMRLCRYVNPVTKTRIEIEEFIDVLSEQRRRNEQNRKTYIVIGFDYWKKPHIKAFLSGTSSNCIFCRTVDKGLRLAKNGNSEIVVWASAKCANDAILKGSSMGRRVWRVEDGFLRSVGLGSDYNYPYSLVLDESGIYFDPKCESDLTKILRSIPTHPDRDRLIERSRALIEMIREHNLTKYNMPSDPTTKALCRSFPIDKRIILVPGQVDDDASVKRGGGRIQSNRELLEAVRARNPDGYIVFKPHPDVTSGNRIGRVPEDVLQRCADRVLEDGSLIDILPHVDEVHTLTSLSGFEALIRGKRVVTYGKPFYAGWGLTFDEVGADVCKGVFLSIEELVAGTLILYPSYWDWKTRAFCRPEDVCFRIIRGEQPEVGLWICFYRVIRSIQKKFFKD